MNISLKAHEGDAEVEEAAATAKKEPASEAGLSVALLGGSNLTLALPDAVEYLASRREARPLDLFVAHGPGRSYGSEAGLPGVRFPPLSQCGLFEALRQTLGSPRDVPLRALLTDIGNDIMYDAAVSQIGDWVEQSAARLQDLGARVAVTSLPLASVLRIPLWKYRLLRPLIYPFHRLTREEALSRAQALQGTLETIARRLGVLVLPARPQWFAFDHIHLRRRARRKAMAEWLDALLELEPRVQKRHASAPLQVPRLALRLHPPVQYRLFGRRRCQPQCGLPVAPGTRLFCF